MTGRMPITTVSVSHGKAASEETRAGSEQDMHPALKCTCRPARIWQPRPLMLRCVRGDNTAVASHPHST
eukprot:10210554-Alexandrium_andersonii.AAC.1